MTADTTGHRAQLDAFAQRMRDDGMTVGVRHSEACIYCYEEPTGEVLAVITDKDKKWEVANVVRRAAVEVFGEKNLLRHRKKPRPV